MKVAIKAANGKYVCAELGGGNVVRANRDAIGPWETFDLIRNPIAPTSVALKTCNGFYLAAEDGGGGTLSADRVSLGVWETFTLANGAFLAHDQQHYVCAEVGSADPILNVTRTAAGPWETFELVPLEQPAPDPKIWRGAFCIPGALPGIPYGDGARIWTPAYGCYDASWRARIRQAYTQRHYTHFVYNCAGLPYRDHYPELADDAARVARDLAELTADGLVPVVVATDDRQPTRVLQSFAENQAAIRICFPLWEQNGPLPATDDQKRLIAGVRNTALKADLYLHFTPGHGSIDANEAGGWKWCQDHGTTGLLAQGDNRFAAETPQVGGEGLESTAIRLNGTHPAWHGLHQLTVKFEYGISDAYNGMVTERAMADYTAAFLAFAPSVVGFTDGGH